MRYKARKFPEDKSEYLVISTHWGDSKIRRDKHGNPIEILDKFGEQITCAEKRESDEAITEESQQLSFICSDYVADVEKYDNPDVSISTWRWRNRKETPKAFSAANEEEVLPF